MGAGSGAAAALVSAEVLAPVLLLCWLCCWPDPGRSDTSSTGEHPKKPVVANDHRRRSSDLFGRRRFGSSVASLHLPSTSGSSKQPLCAHRSHEDIPPRIPRPLLPPEGEGRYHSAPSVIHEILHRRDWERSSTTLHIPLKPERTDSRESDSDSSPEPPHAEPESSSIDTRKSEEKLNCKKHHTNIKSSKNKKEATRVDIKDTDATETQFYIGDVAESRNSLAIDNDAAVERGLRVKDEKQSFNESVKIKDHERCEDSVALGCYRLQTFDYNLDCSPDRSGAAHEPGSRASLLTCLSAVPPSVEPPPVPWSGYSPLGRVLQSARGRHASDGDILAPAQRPESGAFSESDLELDLEGGERPPAYEEVTGYQTQTRLGARETAI